MSGEHRKFYRLLKAGKRKECARALEAHLAHAEQLFKAVIDSEAAAKAKRPPGARTS